MSVVKNKSAPWLPVKYLKRHAAAIQAVARGDASEHQQRIFTEYLVNDLCGTYDLSFRPDSTRDSDFAEGRRFVGLQLVKLMKINLSIIKEDV